MSEAKNIFLNLTRMVKLLVTKHVWSNKKKIRFQNLTLKIPAILQHLLPNPKPITIMTQHSLNFVENNSILVKLNLLHDFIFSPSILFFK